MLLTKDSLSRWLPYYFDVTPWIQYANLRLTKEKNKLDSYNSTTDIFKDNDAYDVLYGLENSEDEDEKLLYQSYLDLENKKRAVSTAIASGEPIGRFRNDVVNLRYENKALKAKANAYALKLQYKNQFNTDNSQYIYSELPENVSLNQFAMGWTPFKIDLGKVKEAALSLGKSISGGEYSNQYNSTNYNRTYENVQQFGLTNEEYEDRLANGDFDLIFENIRKLFNADKIIDPNESARLDSAIINAFKSGMQLKMKSNTKTIPLTKTSGSGKGSGSNSDKAEKLASKQYQQAKDLDGINSKRDITSKKTEAKTTGATQDKKNDGIPFKCNGVSYTVKKVNGQIVIYSSRGTKLDKPTDAVKKKANEAIGGSNKNNKAYGGKLFAEGGEEDEEEDGNIQKTDYDLINQEALLAIKQAELPNTQLENRKKLVDEFVDELYRSITNFDAPEGMSYEEYFNRRNTLDKMDLATIANLVMSSKERIATLDLIDKNVGDAIDKIVDALRKKTYGLSAVKTLNTDKTILQLKDIYNSLIYIDRYNAIKNSIYNDLGVNNGFEQYDMNTYELPRLTPAEEEAIKAFSKGYNIFPLINNGDEWSNRLNNTYGISQNLSANGIIGPYSQNRALLGYSNVSPTSFNFMTSPTNGAASKIYNSLNAEALKYVNNKADDYSLEYQENEDRPVVNHSTQFGGNKLLWLVDENKLNIPSDDPNNFLSSNLANLRTFKRDTSAWGWIKGFINPENRGYKFSMKKLLNDGTGFDLSDEEINEIEKKVIKGGVMMDENQFYNLMMETAQLKAIEATPSNGKVEKDLEKKRMNLFNSAYAAATKYQYMMLHARETNYNDDGKITKDELNNYVTKVARAKTEGDLSEIGLGNKALSFAFGFMPDLEKATEINAYYKAVNGMIEAQLSRVNENTEAIANGRILVSGTGAGGFTTKTVVENGEVKKYVVNTDPQAAQTTLKTLSDGKYDVLRDKTAMMVYPELNKIRLSIKNSSGLMIYIYVPIGDVLQTNNSFNQADDIKALIRLGKSLLLKAVVAALKAADTKDKKLRELYKLEAYVALVYSHNAFKDVKGMLLEFIKTKVAQAETPDNEN